MVGYVGNTEFLKSNKLLICIKLSMYEPFCMKRILYTQNMEMLCASDNYIREMKSHQHNCLWITCMPFSGIYRISTSLEYYIKQGKKSTKTYTTVSSNEYLLHLRSPVFLRTCWSISAMSSR